MDFRESWEKMEQKCNHPNIRVEPILDFESDQIFAMKLCENCKAVIEIKKTWSENLEEQEEESGRL